VKLFVLIGRPLSEVSMAAGEVCGRLLPVGRLTPGDGTAITAVRGLAPTLFYHPQVSFNPPGRKGPRLLAVAQGGVVVVHEVTVDMEPGTRMPRAQTRVRSVMAGRPTPEIFVRPLLENSPVLGS
jgi:hypothetical protein